MQPITGNSKARSQQRRCVYGACSTIVAASIGQVKRASVLTSTLALFESNFETVV
jgi:hypothetical protein